MAKAQSAKKKKSKKKKSGGTSGAKAAPAKKAEAAASTDPPTAAGFACDVDIAAPSAPVAEPEAGPATFRVHRRTENGFEGVPEMDYKPSPSGTSAESSAANDESPGNSWARVVRRELVGRHGPDPCDFHVRHFEVGPGGFSSFEKHRHIHAVIAESGRGEVWLDGEWVTLAPGDVVYIGPNTPHQLRCPAEAEQAFGFFCIVDAVRDRPVVLDEGAGGAGDGA